MMRCFCAYFDVESPQTARVAVLLERFSSNVKIETGD